MAFQVLSQHLQIFLLLLRDPLEHQSLSRLRQQRPQLPAGLLKDPISKTLKAQHVNIQNSPIRMHGDNRLLRLHRKLLRHDHQKTPFRMTHCLFYDVTKSVLRFPGAGIPENKL